MVACSEDARRARSTQHVARLQVTAQGNPWDTPLAADASGMHGRVKLSPRRNRDSSGLGPAQHRPPELCPSEPALRPPWQGLGTRDRALVSRSPVRGTYRAGANPARHKHGNLRAAPLRGHPGKLCGPSGPGSRYSSRVPGDQGSPCKTTQPSSLLRRFALGAPPAKPRAGSEADRGWQMLRPFHRAGQVLRPGKSLFRLPLPSEPCQPLRPQRRREMPARGEMKAQGSPLSLSGENTAKTSLERLASPVSYHGKGHEEKIRVWATGLLRSHTHLPRLPQSTALIHPFITSQERATKEQKDTPQALDT